MMNGAGVADADGPHARPAVARRALAIYIHSTLPACCAPGGASARRHTIARRARKRKAPTRGPPVAAAATRRGSRAPVRAAEASLARKFGAAVCVASCSLCVLEDWLGRCPKSSEERAQTRTKTRSDRRERRSVRSGEGRITLTRISKLSAGSSRTQGWCCGK